MHPFWDVNCPFPFPSDQGGHDKTNLTKHNNDRSSGKRSGVLLDSAAAIFSGRLPEGRSLRLEAVRCGVVYYQVFRKASEHSATMSVWSSNGKILAKVKNGRIVRVDIHTDLDEAFSYSEMSADEEE